MADADIRRYSHRDLAAMHERGDVVPTEAGAVVAEIDDEFWQTAQVVMPRTKQSVHLRVDEDVLAWFRSLGKGHLTRMNAVLRSDYEAHET